MTGAVLAGVLVGAALLAAAIGVVTLKIPKGDSVGGGPVLALGLMGWVPAAAIEAGALVSAYGQLHPVVWGIVAGLACVSTILPIGCAVVEELLSNPRSRR